MIVNNILFFISGFMIFWAMIGYPICIKILGKIYKDRENKKDYNFTPTVTVMIVAHNEEKVIREKLDNVCKLDYPKDKIKILVASDNSTDLTNDIVNKYILEHPDENISLYLAKERKGKTNAQNEAQKTVTTEFLVMTDANAMLEENAVKELMASFSEKDIAYVTGCLKYTNNENSTADKENTYWDSDVKIRDIEGRIQTITAGNGALYACRNSEYYDFRPIDCHDSAMPLYYALKGKRAINNMEAVAYEKAGENDGDEFKRKVRMNRLILDVFKNTWKSMNIFKYKWFSFFYFGHRTCRYLLWLNHLILLVTNVINFKNNNLFLATFFVQLTIYIFLILGILFQLQNKYMKLLNYYFLTVLAQWAGVVNILTGKAKPTWEKAESTR